MMAPSSVLIVDDEPLARRRLRTGLDQMDCIGRIAEARDGAEALEYISTHPSDILLVDIKMPRMGGLDLVGAVSARSMCPAVIFVTAFDNFAIHAFERDAIDYLLKPVEFTRLEEAIRRARQRMEQVDALERISGLQRTLERLQTREDQPRIAEADFWIKDRDVITRVSAANIHWIEAERDYVRLHLEGRSHLMRSTLTAVEEKLPADTFMRVHRSAIVCRQQIESLSHTGTGSYTLHLRSGHGVPVGRSYRKQIMAEIDEAKKPGRG